MNALALLLVVSATPAAESPRLRASELSVGLSGVGSGYTFRDGRFGDFTVGPDLRGSALLGGFTLSGAALVSVPTDARGVLGSTAFTGRLGYTGERFQLTAGAVLQVAPDADPALQLLPSFRGEVELNRWARFSLSLFGDHGLVPVQLAWEQERFFIGYCAPLGLAGGLRTPLGESLTIDVRALAFRLYNAELAMITVSGVVGGAR